MKTLKTFFLIILAAFATSCRSVSSTTADSDSSLEQTGDETSGVGDADTDSDSDGDGDTDADSDTGAGADTDTDTDTDADTDTDTDTDMRDPCPYPYECTWAGGCLEPPQGILHDEFSCGGAAVCCELNKDTGAVVDTGIDTVSALDTETDSASGVEVDSTEDTATTTVADSGASSDAGVPCTPEGEMPPDLNNPNCCPGLRRLYYIPITDDGMCLTIIIETDAACVACSNGICDRHENACNCPEDCERPTIDHDAGDLDAGKASDFGFSEILN